MRTLVFAAAAVILPGLTGTQLAGIPGLTGIQPGRVPGLTGTQAAQKKVDIVSVTGCLREQGTGNWMLVAATEPVASIANQAPKNEWPTAPPDGKNSFKLIGVTEFDLPSHKDHTVVVKGLLIKAAPTSRLNVTSVADALPSCAPAAPK